MSEQDPRFGEQIDPDAVDADLWNEHLARYLYALPLCAGKSVLDTGCGVGYGCFRLAAVARCVVGVDNTHTALRAARSKYWLPNIQYLRADCHSLPFASRTFDVVTSFELIEHLPNANSYLSEVGRVLKPSGLLLISTPNRQVYAEHRGHEPNPFHVREYELEEFELLLKQYFRSVKILGQVHVPAVGIFSYPARKEIPAIVLRQSNPETAAYVICVCSNRQQQPPGSMLLVPSAGNVLLERERHIRLLLREEGERRAQLARLQAEFDEKAAWATQLNQQVQAYERQRGELQQLVEERTRSATQLNNQIRALQQTTERHQTRIQELTWLWQKATARKRRFFLSCLVPLDWLIGALLIATEICGRLGQRVAPRRPPTFEPPDTSRCSIVVLSWEGKDLLAESLPPLLDAVRRSEGNHEVIVVDNGSTDGTSEYVRSHFPEVRLVRSNRNLYYTGGNNLGVQTANSDIVVLLNNDMIVEPDFLKPLLKPFEQEEVFAVASQVFFHDPTKPREETGKTRATFNGCDLDWGHEPITPADEQRGYVPVFWAHGGAVAVDRRKFEWLGRLDPLYDPFYLEDADLSYRAWKARWQSLVAVNSHVIHKHRATNKPRYGERLIAETIRRNQYLFLWKNFTDLDLLMRHFLRSTQRRIHRAGTPGVGIRFEVRAYWRALAQLPRVLWQHFRVRRYAIRQDREVLAIVSTPPAAQVEESEIDFRQASFQDYLGGGWHAWEKSCFRWMSPSATVFLRAPSPTACLVIEGYAPSDSQYTASPVILRIAVAGTQRAFHLHEGDFQHSFLLSGLSTEKPVEVSLQLNSRLQAPQDNRELGVIVSRIALIPSKEESVSNPEGGPHEEGTTKRSVEGTTQVSPLLGNCAATVQENGIARRQKRLLFVCAHLPCLGVHAGGGRMFNLIKRLAKHHQITVLSFVETEAERKHVPELAAFCEHVEVIFRGQSLFARNPFGMYPPRIVYEFHHAGMQELVNSFLEKGAYDLLQCEYLQTAHLAPRHPRIPALLTHMEVLSLAYYRGFRDSTAGFKRRGRAFLDWMRMLNYESRFFPRFTAIIVLTEEERVFLQRYFPTARIYVHPTGIECDRFSPNGLPEDATTITFVGYFRHEPNVHGAQWFLEQVLPKVLRNVPEAKIQLVGASPPAALQRWEKTSPNIRVTGRVPDIRPYLEQSRVVIAPLLTGAGFRGKVIEAWAMEKPVVATSLACFGIPFVDGETGFIADDAETFAQRICQLLQDEQLCRRMGRTGRRVVESHFSWDKLADLHNKIYEQIL